jgi:hypothetical protein
MHSSAAAGPLGCHLALTGHAYGTNGKSRGVPSHTFIGNPPPKKNKTWWGPGTSQPAQPPSHPPRPQVRTFSSLTQVPHSVIRLDRLR